MSTLTNIVSAVIVLACLSAASWALFHAFPKAVRLVALYRLHDIRDTIYRAGDAHPEIRESLLYRDLEFMATYAIYCARELSWWHALGMAAPANGARQRDKVSWRGTKYRREIETLFACFPRGEIIALLDTIDEWETVLWWRGILGDPLVALALLPALLVISVGKVFKTRVKTSRDERFAAEAVYSIRLPSGPIPAIREMLFGGRNDTLALVS